MKGSRGESRDVVCFNPLVCASGHLSRGFEGQPFLNARAMRFDRLYAESECLGDLARGLTCPLRWYQGLIVNPGDKLDSGIGRMS